MVSCQKEEETQDTTAPSVRLELSGNPEKLYNEVVVSATASDNDGIERVVFYANNDSLGQLTTAPYEMQWNTKEVEDGPYMLKAIAYDAAGNKGEEAMEVTVNNTLLLVQVEEGYLQEREGSTQERWIFLSDKDGNIIGEEQQLQNGETLRWDRPADFNSDSIYLNRLFYNKYTYSWAPKTYTNITVYTYADFTLDEVNFSAYNYPDSIGKADINIQNDFGGNDYYHYQTRVPGFAGSNYTTAGQASYSLSMAASSQKGFSTYENTPTRADQHLREKYFRFDELEAGSAYNFHTSEYAPMEEQTISFSFEPMMAFAYTFGYMDADVQNSYFLDNSSFTNYEAGELKLFSTNEFPYTRSYISAEKENQRFYLSTLNQLPSVINLPSFSANVEAAGTDEIAVSTTGTADIANGFWAYTEDSESKYLTARRAFYFGSTPGSSYTLPEIPSSLLQRYPGLSNPMEFRWSWAANYETLDTYQDVLRRWFTDSYDGLEYLEYSGRYIYPENAGGRRLAASPEMENNQSIAEQEALREMGALGY